MNETRISRRDVIKIAASGSLFLLPPAGPLLAQEQIGKFDLAVGTVDTFYTVAYVTFASGYFKAEGLDVGYVNANSGPRAAQMLTASQSFISLGGASDPMTISVAGKEANLIFGLDDRITYANLLVHKDNFESGKIKKVSDLAGQTIACTQPKSSSWLMAAIIAERAGIRDKIDIRGLGDLVTLLGAVKTKQVGASIATMSMLESATREGWGTTLFDCTDDAAWNQTFGGEIPGLAAYVLTDSIRRRPKEVQAFVNAMAKGQDYINKNSARAITDLIHKDFLASYPKEAVEKTVALYKEKVWSKNNMVSAASYNRLLDMYRGRLFDDQEVARVPYEKVVDMSFLARARKA